MGITWLKNLKLFKGARNVKNISTVGDIAKASKLSKVGSAVKNLPVVRIIAGSAVGIIIIDSWNNAVKTVSDVLGVSEESSTLILGCIVAVVLALVITFVINIFRRSR